MKHFKRQTMKTYMKSEMISSDFGRSAQRFSLQWIIFLQRNVTEKCATYLDLLQSLMINTMTSKLPMHIVLSKERIEGKLRTSFYMLPIQLDELFSNGNRIQRLMMKYFLISSKIFIAFDLFNGI